MRFRSFSILLLIISVFASAGCGGSKTDEGGTNSKTGSASPFNQNTAANVNIVVNLPEPGANTPAENSAPPVNSQIPANVVKNTFTKPAPDNSEVSVALGENFVRTRTFKNHPQILKIEETTLIGENNRKIIKVYLKNGKIREIPEEKFKDVMIVPAENIVKAAG